MKHNRYKKAISFLAAFFLLISFFLGGCTNLQPLEPQQPQQPQPPTTPGKPTIPEPSSYTVTYSYSANGTEPVKLSANNLKLKVGQKLTLQPAQGVTQNTHFSSSGEYFFGDIMQQDTNQDNTKVIFTAIKPGKGKLQIIPNTNQTSRATDFWVTVE